MPTSSGTPARLLRQDGRGAGIRDRPCLAVSAQGLLTELRGSGCILGSSDDCSYTKRTDTLPSASNSASTLSTCTDGVDRRHRPGQHNLACLEDLVMLGEFVG